MKRILGIVGSPRKRGNTHQMVSSVLEGARAAGARTEILFLGDLAIRECDGCHACWRGKPCVKGDDMVGIYPKIARSDALIFGTPVYWFGPTGIMKTFVDRFVYFNCSGNRADVRNKPALLLVPFEDTTPETADLVVRFFERSLEYLEMRLAATVLAPGVTVRGEVRKDASRMAECREWGKRIAAAE